MESYGNERFPVAFGHVEPGAIPAAVGQSRAEPQVGAFWLVRSHLFLVTSCYLPATHHGETRQVDWKFIAIFFSFNSVEIISNVISVFHRPDISRNKTLMVSVAFDLAEWWI